MMVELLVAGAEVSHQESSFLSTTKHIGFVGASIVQERRRLMARAGSNGVITMCFLLAVWFSELLSLLGILLRGFWRREQTTRFVFSPRGAFVFFQCGQFHHVAFGARWLVSSFNVSNFSTWLLAPRGFCPLFFSDLFS
jgi:hypothetical protein